MTTARKIRNRFIPRQHNKPTKLNYSTVCVCVLGVWGADYRFIKGRTERNNDTIANSVRANMCKTREFWWFNICLQSLSSPLPRSLHSSFPPYRSKRARQCTIKEQLCKCKKWFEGWKKVQRGGIVLVSGRQRRCSEVSTWLIVFHGFPTGFSPRQLGNPAFQNSQKQQVFSRNFVGFKKNSVWRGLWQGSGEVSKDHIKVKEQPSGPELGKWNWEDKQQKQNKPPLFAPHTPEARTPLI